MRSQFGLKHILASAALVVALGCMQSADEQAPPPPDTAAAPQELTPQQDLPTIDGVFDVTPVDEATRDASLVATRDSLLDIARRRDTTALAGFLDPNIRYSFGASDGRRGFFSYWMQYESLDKLWITIEDVLTHGGRFRNAESFTAPWTFTALPDSIDAFTHLIIRDANVRVYTQPDSNTTPIGIMSHTVVRAGENRAAGPWSNIVLPDGRQAYVLARHIRSPIDYRIGLLRSNDKWIIQFFVAGD